MLNHQLFILTEFYARFVKDGKTEIQYKKSNIYYKAEGNIPSFLYLFTGVWACYIDWLLLHFIKSMS